MTRRTASNRPRAPSSDPGGAPCSLRPVEAALTPDPRRWKALVLVCARSSWSCSTSRSSTSRCPRSPRTSSSRSRRCSGSSPRTRSRSAASSSSAGARPTCFGRRKVFIAGMAVFTFGSLMCGFAQSGAWLIAFRALPGLRRRDRLARDALDHQRRVPARRRRAEQGVRHLGRASQGAARRRRAPRRRADRVPRLAVDLLRQRPGRDRDHLCSRRGSSRRASRGRRPAHRPARGALRDRRPRRRSSTRCPARRTPAGRRCRRSG